MIGRLRRTVQHAVIATRSARCESKEPKVVSGDPRHRHAMILQVILIDCPRCSIETVTHSGNSVTWTDGVFGLFIEQTKLTSHVSGLRQIHGAQSILTVLGRSARH